MKKTLFCASLCCLCFGLASAQQVLQDDFSDGDFTNNPTWLGDVDKFAVTDGELRLLDPSPGSNNIATLYVPAPTALDAATAWEFYVRLNFSPSATNFARVYLSASAPGLAEPQQGYFIRVGGIAGDQDALDLFRQDGSTTTLLFSGEAGAVGGATAVARVRVERSPAGEWSMYADYSGGTDYQFQGSAVDDTHPMGAFFGFYCRYTSTRNEHFFFDDVRVEPLFEDTIPPVLVGAEAVSALEVLARFDEPLDSAAAADAANYAIDSGIGQPLSAALEAGDPSAVRLVLATPLQNTASYVLTAEGIRDLSGNTSGPQSAAFTYYDLQPAGLHDVIISEIYADETSSQGLPEEEFFELYNRSDKVIQLSSLRYTVSNSTRTLPSYLLLPGAYVTICPVAAEAAYGAFGPAVGLPSFPRLPNAGSTMRLTDADEQLIFTVAYSNQWYRDPGTSNGGYSLELIELDGPYDCPGNWRASRAPLGGTPGQPNSRLGESGDDTPPALLAAVLADELEIQLAFNKPLDAETAGQAENYRLAPSIAILEAAVAPDRQSVSLTLESPLAPATVYELVVDKAVADCMGNPIGERDRAVLALTEPAAPGELVFSEIYANPNPSQGLPDAEFFELHNRSGKFIQLSSLRYTLGSSTRNLPPHLLLPGAYVVICPEAFQADFAALGPTVGLPSFPQLPNSSGNMRLADLVGQLISAVAYRDTWYRDPGAAGGGFSLELIELDGPDDCPGNWRASRAPLGGTPGQPNSRLGETGDDTPTSLLTAVPESDFEILLRFDKPLDAAAAERAENYRLLPTIPIEEAMMTTDRQGVVLFLDGTLAPSTVYELIVDRAVTDCLGNPMGENDRATLGLVAPMAPGDVVINELLFLPEVGGSPFVELYNRSDKFVNLRGAEIRNRERTTGNVAVVVNQDYLLLPGAYAVVARSPADVGARYAAADPRAMLEANLPTLDSRSGNVSLIVGGIAIDSFDYNDNLHYPLLDNKRGVSLERISPDSPTQDAGNWHSAASTVGFATPTARNSQFVARPSALSRMIDLPNTTFSPDGDGFEDVLLIHYELDRPGYTLKLHVYDSHGRLVRRLVNNEILPLSGTLQWDGTTDELTRARLGIYVLWFELFTPDGTVEREKRACVLAGRLE